MSTNEQFQQPQQPHQTGNPYTAQQPPPPPVARKRKKWPWIVGGLVLIIVVFAAASAGKSETPSAESGVRISGDSGTNQSGQSSDGDSGVTRLKFGETYTWPGGESITISAPDEYTSSNQFLAAPAGKRYVALDVTVVNKGDDEYNVMSTKLTVQHSGQVAQQNYAAGDPLPDVQLPPGGKTTFTVVYEVSEKPGTLQISVEPNVFASDTVYFTGKF